MKRRDLITFALLGIVVFAGLAFYGDLPELLDQLFEFPAVYWLMALGLALVNYVIRWIRWHYYLHLLGIKPGVWISSTIFVSGLAMAISPGRVGELAKSYYLKEKLDVPVSRSSAAVITERFTDMIAILLLSSWGLFLVPFGWIAFPLVLIFAAMLIIFLVSPWGTEKVQMLPVPKGLKSFLFTSREAFQQVLSPKPLVLAVALSLLAWLAEGTAMWLVLQGLDTSVSYGEAVSIYAAATLLGALTLLPGGLVGTEGGMIALLLQADLSNTEATTATFIIRICTLWFAVGIGILGMAYVQFMLPKHARSSSDQESTTTNLAGDESPDYVR